MSSLLSILGRRRVPLALLALSAVLVPVEIVEAQSRGGTRSGSSSAGRGGGGGGSRASAGRSSGRSSVGSSRSSGASRSSFGSRSSGRSSFGSSGSSRSSGSRSSFGSSRSSVGSSRTGGSSRSSFGSTRSTFPSTRTPSRAPDVRYDLQRSRSGTTTPSRVPYRPETGRSSRWSGDTTRGAGRTETITPSTLGPSMGLDRFQRSSSARSRDPGTLAPSRLGSSRLESSRLGSSRLGSARSGDLDARTGPDLRRGDDGRLGGDAGGLRSQSRLDGSAFRSRSADVGERQVFDRNETGRARMISGADRLRSRTLATNVRSRTAVREALRHDRPPVRDHVPDAVSRDFDKFGDKDWDDYWEDYWDEYWDEYFDNYEDFVEDNWWWGFFTPFWHYPYYHHHFFGISYPYYHSHWWFHFHFGYYPIYHHRVYPYYVSYQPVYVPTYSTAVVYQPVYVEPATVDAGPATSVNEVPPYLAEQLNQLSGNESAITWLESGARDFKAGHFETAADAFRRAMLLEQDNAVPKLALAHALFALGDYTNAAFMIRRGMQILPQWPTVGTSLHELYGNPDDLAEHTIALRVHLDAHPDDGDARFLLGYVSYFSGDLDGAEAAFQSVIAANPGNAETQAFLNRIAEIRATLPADVVEVPAPSGG